MDSHLIYYILLLGGGLSFVMIPVTYYQQYKSNKRFEERMRKLGFNIDGSQLRNADEILSTENQEVRSALIEKWDGENLYSRDKYEGGELFESGITGRKFVKVLNSTAEPDGSFKTYWLRVPAHINTAKEAVAWTFGLDEDDYKPIIET